MVKYVRQIWLMFSDILIVNLAVYLSLLLRFDGHIPMQYINLFYKSMYLLTSAKIILYYIFGLYKSLWRFASIEELIKVVLATLSGSFVSFSIGILSGQPFPRSVYFIAWMVTTLAIGGVRLAYRVSRRVYLMFHRGSNMSKIQNVSRVLIIGAGAAGSMIIKEIDSLKKGLFVPVVLLDDDKSKHGFRIHNVPIIGDISHLKEVVSEYEIDEIIIALPSVSAKRMSEIVRACQKTKCKLKTLPKIYDIIESKVTVSNLREVNIEDLLGRDEVKLNIKEMSGYIENETVLVTGGGGSIGSELCRQIAKFAPKKLVILDIYENNAYELEQELKRKYSKLKFEVVIASVRDAERMKEVFNTYRPGVVFHAAAHKHVPLMEANPAEAIKNNVLGTYKTAKCADDFGVKRFVLISTDKAVNPTNIMGATKRVAEMIIQAMNKVSKTDFVAVRFGNVLGSNGSVIPLFKKQIAEGGPVTVTHPDITRYFMTIPEASKLVIQAGAMAKGGEIFVLDMGDPVKIVDLAESMIKLSGYEPGVNMKIEFSGLRPGEKLYEELLLSEEGVVSTHNEGIFVAKPMEICLNRVKRHIEGLEIVMNYPDKLRETLAMIVPAYSYATVNQEVAASLDSGNIKVEREKIRRVKLPIGELQPVRVEGAFQGKG